MKVYITWTDREYIDPKFRGARWKARAAGAVLGEVSFMPLKLAYALTVHKTQGLTLDKVQVVVDHWFMSKPAMIYVALSRARSPEGVTIVGPKGTLVRHVKTHPKVERWL